MLAGQADDFLHMSFEMGGRMEHRAQPRHVPLLNPAHNQQRSRVLRGEHVRRFEDDAIERLLGLGAAFIRPGGKLRGTIARK